MKKNLILSNILFSVSILALTNNSFSQSVGIGTSTPNSSAQLEIKSNTKGLLIPRTSSTSRNAIANPAKALMIYDSATSSFWFYNGNDWIESGRIDPPRVNTFFGFQTGNSINLGVNNTGIGHQALWANTDGSFNTALGYYSLVQNTTGNSNTGVGAASLRSNSTGIENTAVGSNALTYNTTGKDNTVIGNNSMFNNTTGNYNTVLGVDAMNSNINGNNNTAVGYQALYNNRASDNVALGTRALFANNSGYSNVAIGPGCLIANNNGSNSVAIGDSALFNSTTGNLNIAIGTQALYSNQSGSGNIALGYQSLYNNNSGGNIAIGFYALEFVDNGNGNIGMGQQALGGNVSGSNNICIGDVSGTFIRASNNTIIGGGANVFTNSIANSTAIGYHATVACNNCLVLGGTKANGDQTKVGINNPLPVTDLHIIQQTANNADNTRGIRLQSPNGNHWRVFLDPGNNYVIQYNSGIFAYIEPVSANYISSSDVRLKQNIAPLPNILDKVMLLEPKTYQYIATAETGRYSYGFIAQEVEKVFPEFVYTGETDMKGIAYSNFSVVAIKAIQEQQKLIELLEKKNKELEERIVALEKSR